MQHFSVLEGRLSARWKHFGRGGQNFAERRILSRFSVLIGRERPSNRTPLRQPCLSLTNALRLPLHWAIFRDFARENFPNTSMRIYLYTRIEVFGKIFRAIFRKIAQCKETLRLPLHWAIFRDFAQEKKRLASLNTGMFLKDPCSVYTHCSERKISRFCWAQCKGSLIAFNALSWKKARRFRRKRTYYRSTLKQI